MKVETRRLILWRRLLFNSNSKTSSQYPQLFLSVFYFAQALSHFQYVNCFLTNGLQSCWSKLGLNPSSELFHLHRFHPFANVHEPFADLCPDQKINCQQLLLNLNYYSKSALKQFNNKKKLELFTFFSGLKVNTIRINELFCQLTLNCKIKFIILELTFKYLLLNSLLCVFAPPELRQASWL